MKKLHFLKYPGAILSDQDILLAVENGLLEVKPFDSKSLQPASLDCHLAKTVAFIDRGKLQDGVIDLKKPVDELMKYEEIDLLKGLIIYPREFLLGASVEWFKFPAQIIGNLDGKSSLGRLGFVVHSTAGFFDPGFAGHATLEITNLTERPLKIYPHIPIGQMRFSVLTSKAKKVYGKALGSKYFNPFSKNPRPVPSQFWKNFR